MATVRSRLARRGRTGRKATGIKLARRKVAVHKHHHRRYAGIRGKPRIGASRKRTGKPAVKRTRRATVHAVRKKRVVRKGLHRKFKGRRKALHPKKRVVRKGLHRTFKGRKKSIVKRHVRPGLKRHFYGRKRKKPPAKAAPAPISAASYLSMF